MNPDTKTLRPSILTIVILVAFLGVFGYLLFKKQTPAIVIQTPPDTQATPAISGDTTNFVSLSIAPGAKVSGATTMTGSVKGAYFFEANARGMLLDTTKSIMKNFPITATGDWMTSDPVAFTAHFDATGVTLGAGYIRIANDNPSGDMANDRYIDIAVVFQ